MKLYCVYHKWGSGAGKYQANIALEGETGRPKQLASGTFPSETAVKKWARAWATKKRMPVNFEKV